MIDILNRITTLRNERHWTEYQLAEKSGMTQSTISSWYHKNLIPSIYSLSKICDAFGITLSQFFYEEDSTEFSSLDDKQMQLIMKASKLTKDQYDALLKFLDTL